MRHGRIAVFLPFIVIQQARRMSSGIRRSPVTLITFDVDGTLVKTANSAGDTNPHSQAFIHAVGRHFGQNDDEFKVKYTTPIQLIPEEKYHGCTDGLILLNTAKCAFGKPASESFSHLPKLFDTMYQYFSDLSDQDIARGIVTLPGTIDSLSKLAVKVRDPEHRVLCGLVTGNVEGIARKKMRACGIYATGVFSPKADEQNFDGENEHTFLGGFGSDYCSGDIDDPTRPYKDRGEQIAIAYRRALSQLREHEELVRVVHVGDAPADILASKWCYEEGKFGPHVTVGCVGVATGSFSAERLRELMGEMVPGRWEPVVLPSGLADPNFIEACGIVTKASYST